MKKSESDVITEMERAGDALDKAAHRVNTAMHEADMSLNDKKLKSQFDTALKDYNDAGARDDAAQKAFRENLKKRK